MLNASEQFEKLMSENVRPLAYPVISIQTADNKITTIYPENIKNLNFEEETDIIGRFLPYQKLTWEELVLPHEKREKLEKYKNVLKFSSVRFGFYQKLSFADPEEEYVDIATLFLAASPVVEENKIKWTAVDVLSLINDEEQLIIQSKNDKKLEDIIALLLVNSRSSFAGTPTFEVLQNIIESLAIQSQKTTINGTFLIEGNVKNSVRNLASAHGKFLKIYPDGMIHLSDYPQIYPFPYTDYHFAKKIMYQKPKITQNDTISTFENHRYATELNPDGRYEVDKVAKSYPNASTIAFRYDFRTFGKVDRDDIKLEGATIFEGANFAISDRTMAIGGLPVIPYESTEFVDSINVRTSGKTFVEKNNLNPYKSDSENARKKLVFLNRYFDNNNCSVEINCLPNLLLECGDYISTETNIENVLDEEEIKNGIVIKRKITYNGGVRATYICHTTAEY